MKGKLLAAAILLATASPLHAQTVSWQGDLFITSVNSAEACATVGMSVGTFGRAVFRPKGLGTNGDVDALAVHFSRATFQLNPSAPAGGSLNGATAATVRYIYGSGGFRETANVNITGSTASPASGYDENTANFRIKLVVRNIFPPQSGPSNCTATFQGSVARRLS